MRERFSESSKSSHQSHQSHQSRQSQVEFGVVFLRDHPPWLLADIPAATSVRTRNHLYQVSGGKTPSRRNQRQVEFGVVFLRDRPPWLLADIPAAANRNFSPAYIVKIHVSKKEEKWE